MAGGLVVQGGAAAILSAVVMLILVGRLVPRSVVEDVRADRDARLAELAAERDAWHAAHDRSEEARHIAQDQAAELLELARTADHMLRSLPSPRPTVEGVTDALDSGLAPQT
ncbi:hypothetical protein [Kitasatospora sp. A2-31]|uniref:hypothetical protein n=1 Tax=Kitasatospora sp. A2-31 TaxID=2916414 RepID=UPI001EE88780|nr:hypothetical protein [Kitasatospora sp. A2-31]MCG6493450.1 hypothetical protein [Kitasatospora sp. A2-31]